MKIGKIQASNLYLPNGEMIPRSAKLSIDIEGICHHDLTRLAKHISSAVQDFKLEYPEPPKEPTT